MGYVLTVYNEKRYREFFLSEQDRAEQELLLLKKEELPSIFQSGMLQSACSVTGAHMCVHML